MPNSNQPVLPNIERYKCNKAQKQPDIGLAVLANKPFFSEPDINDDATDAEIND